MFPVVLVQSWYSSVGVPLAPAGAHAASPRVSSGLVKITAASTLPGDWAMASATAWGELAATTSVPYSSPVAAANFRMIDTVFVPAGANIAVVQGAPVARLVAASNTSHLRTVSCASG